MFSSITMKWLEVACMLLWLPTESLGFLVQSASSHASLVLNAATSLPLGQTIEGTPAAEETKVGVLLLNLGGPETGDDVEGMYSEKVLTAFCQELVHHSFVTLTSSDCAFCP